jgi:hypothetical protein
MNPRTFFKWVVPCIAVAFVAMQLFRFLPRTRLTNLAGLRQPALAPSFSKAYSVASTASNDKMSEPASHIQEQNQEEKKSAPLALPEPPAEGIQLDVSTGQGVSLDHLGPMVVNKDGTISRITNWDAMSDMEKKNTLRILQKRNKERRDALNEAPTQ